MTNTPVPEKQEALEATLTPNAERSFELILGQALAAGESPPPDSDCAGAYRWARQKGAWATWGMRMRITLTAHRYAQVNPDLVRVKPVPTPPRAESDLARFSCGDIAADRPDESSPGAELFLPNRETDPGLTAGMFHAFDPDGNEGGFALNAGQHTDLPVSVGASRLTPLTDFVLQFTASVNGKVRTYDLQDGDRPFTVGPHPDGGGGHIAGYVWCPGSPGKVVRYPAGGGPIPGCG